MRTLRRVGALRVAFCGLMLAFLATVGIGGQSATQAPAPAPAASGAAGLVPAVKAPAGMSLTEYSQYIGKLATQAAAGGKTGAAATSAPAAFGTDSLAVPTNMVGNSAFSAAVTTNIAGPFNHVALFGDWDGREDFGADHFGKIDDFSTKMTPPGLVLTRSAISEHTIANGFAENVFYYGDSVGNVYVAQSSNTSTLSGAPLSGANIFTINLPTILNAFGTLQSDDQVVVTGLCVSPVSDLSSYANVNGSFAPYNGVTGEILYVTYWDTGGGLRTAGGGLVKSGVLAFPVADITSGATAAPGIISPAGFPVQIGGSFGVVYSAFANLAGCAVDDDGNLYFHEVDLQQMGGGHIAKISRTGTNKDRSLATSGIATIINLTPSNGILGTSSGPVAQVNTVTNFSGTSPLFGNIVALAAGQGDTVYAAVARSLVATDDAATQATEGPFANPAAGIGPTPSMIISFRDYAPPTATPSAVPVSDGFADSQVAGAAVVAGVNNFRVFVYGNGPDLRTAAGTASPVWGTVADTLKLDMQIDFSVFSGLTVDEEGKVYVISGGAPAGLGLNPSPTRGEILLFSDDAPQDRRADYIDFRGDVPPNPISGNSTQGDGDSDRFDHIFWQAPLDQLAGMPAGISGLNRGFLRYLNRNAPSAITGLPTGATQADDATTAAAVPFAAFDPGHQVDGGDRFNAPARGDESPNGGFEFSFGANVPLCTTPWNAFFLNSNGNITFQVGDATAVPTSTMMLTGPPRIAGAFGNLNPAARAVSTASFPLQAMGFAGINHFKVRWIDVPESGQEAAGQRNSFSINLYDDGTGTDENGTPGPPYNTEGPTDLRFSRSPTDGTLVGRPPRLNGTGPIALTYERMDTKAATAGINYIAGYSTGGLADGSVAPTDLSEAGRSAAIGNYTQGAIYEIFTGGTFDLRSEGTGANTSTGQTDHNRERIDFVGKVCSLPIPFISGTKTVTGSFAVGGVLTYTVVLTNTGGVAQADLAGPEFYDALPSTVALLTGSASSGTLTTTAATNQVSWNGSIGAGASVTLTYQAVIMSGGGTAAVANQGTILMNGNLSGANTVTDVTDNPNTVAARDATTTGPLPLSYFLAEGATSSFFHTDILLANPNAVPAPIVITYLNSGGAPVTQPMTLAPTSRTTVQVNSVPGMDSAAFSTRVDSTSALPLIVERTMSWDATGYGSSGEKATDSLSKRWLFAEGSQGFFSTYVLLANTTTVPANVTLSFLTEGAGTIVKSVAVPADSRVTFDVSGSPDLVNQNFSIIVDSDVPIAAERSMYFGTPLFNGGHDAIGATAASTHWMLAEGATGNFFKTFVLMGNPNASTATATVTYLLASGGTVVKTWTIPPSGRVTVNVETEDPLLANTPVSIAVTATLPIVVERAMYWPGAPTTWYETHASGGVTDPGTHWGLAEGRVGGTQNYQTYILLGNAGAATANVTVTFLRSDGSTVVKTYAVGPTSRFNIDVGGMVPELSNESFGANIVSDQPIFVERSLYSDVAGVTWAAGTNATASRLP